MVLSIFGLMEMFVSGRKAVSKTTVMKSYSNRNFNSSEMNLQKECGNHARLGQWELFRGTIEKLNDKDNVKDEVSSLLLSFYSQPHNFSVGSIKLSTPFDLFWLCAKLHEEVNDDARGNDILVRDAIFRQILASVLPITSEHFVKELYTFYRHLACLEKSSDNYATVYLSSESRGTIMELIKANPVLGVCLLKSLIIIEVKTLKGNRSNIPHILYDLLDYEILLLETRGGLCTGRSAFEKDPTCIVVTHPNDFRFLLGIADALFTCTINVGLGQTEFYHNIAGVEELVNRLWRLSERDVLYRNVILDCMLCQPELLLLRIFYKVDNKLRNRVEFVNSSITGDVLSISEKFLRLTYDRHRNMEMKEMFSFSIANGCDVIEMFVLSCIELITSGEHLLACSILSSLAFRRLKGLVFLLSWPKVKNALGAKRIIEAFESVRDETNDGEIQLIECCNWLIHKAKLVLGSLKTKSVRRCLNSRRNIVDIMFSLQSRSTLNILHNCYYLNQLEREIAYKELLRCTEDLNFHSRAVLSGFYLLYDLFSVVLASKKVNLLTAGYQSRQRKSSEEYGSGTKKATSINYEEIEVYYMDNVTDPLRRIRDGISDLHPPCFRIEVLENAFSLLFLTHLNIRAGCKQGPPSTSSNTDDDEVEHDGNKLTKFKHKNEPVIDWDTSLCLSPESATTSDDRRHSRSKKNKVKSGLQEMLHQYPFSSENAGSLSTESSISSRPLQVGFLLRDSIVRDILDCLQHCVLATTFSIDSYFEVDLGEKDESLFVSCSVPRKMASQRAARLSQYVSEAIWRLQLTTDDSMSKEVGVAPWEAREFLFQLKTNMTFRFYNFVEEDEDSEDGIENKKRLKYQSDTPSHSILLKTPIRNESNQIIPKMLSQHDTLLNICLQQNNLVKAEQVVKMFGLESSEKAIEVEFATLYEEAIRRFSRTSAPLLYQQKCMRKDNSPIRMLSEQRHSHWDCIIEAARAGADAAETLIADELLASHKIPCFAELNEPGIMNQWLPCPIDWRGLIRGDLAVVACKRIPACRNLLEASYSTLSRGICQAFTRATGLRIKSAAHTRGILGFLENILLFESSETILQQDTQENIMLKYVWQSRGAIRDRLLSGMWPLSSKDHKKVSEKWHNLASIIHRLKQSFLSEKIGSEEHWDIATILQTTSHTTTVQASESKSTRPSKHPIHVQFCKLQQCTAAMYGFWDEKGYISVPQERLSSNDLSPTPAYLITLYDYSKRLSAILPEFPSEFAQTERTSYFSVFLKSPLTILERLLFDDSISSKLENFAKQLGLDLVQVIVKQYCPAIASTYMGGSQLLSLRETNEDQEVLALNKTNLQEPTSQRLCKMQYRHLKFIEGRCTLAAVLVQALGCAETVTMDGERIDYAIVLHPVLHRIFEYRGASGDSQNVSYALSVCTSSEILRTKFEKWYAEENWIKALEYLESWECRSPTLWDMIKLLRDLVLSHLIMDHQRNGVLLPWLFVSRIHDITLRSKLVLEHFWDWPACGALAAFDVCLSHRGLDQSTSIELKGYMQKIRLYSKVCDKILNGDIVWTTDFFNCSWQLVYTLFTSNPLLLLRQLFDAECYGFILDWSCLHPVPESLKQIVNESYLLDASSSDRTVVQKVLGCITDSERRVFIYEQLLSRSRKLHNESIVLQLMIEMKNCVGNHDGDLIQVTHHKIGEKILLCFPEDEKLKYLCLISHPHFMIEQMLIDIKIEPLERAFQIIRDDLKVLSEMSSLSFASLNRLLEIYAFKAVDFRVVQTLSKDRIEANLFGSVRTHTHKKYPFTVPVTVPSKQQWIPDAIVTTCMVCSTERFSMFNRRHHCRRCGRVVCGNCSQQNIRVEGYGDIEVRICDDCYDHANDLLESGMHYLERRLKARITGVYTDGGKDRVGILKREASSEYEHSRRSIWNLSTDETHNRTAREEFSYEQAPNISLCLSILDLHWDQHRSGLYILELADNMFRLLQPIESGKPNPEVDYNLVINMLKSVLLSAKVKFSRSCDSDGVNRCDLYLGLADLLKLLVVANCKDLIPVGDLTQNDVVRRLRDKLILNERWALALDISTKGGLDVIGVWSAWGTAYLRIGRHSAAREKFALCFQRLKDQNKVNQTNALLQQILVQLTSSKNIPIDEKQLRVNLESKNMESFIHNECLFYINTFGNQATFLSFHFQNNFLEDALHYTLEEKCTPTLFIDELVMPSIKKGRFLKLLKEMNSTHSSLEKWIPYLGPICRHLERYNFIHSLYDLQIFMKDYVRAALACILFYRQGIRDYVVLHDHLPHLNQAKQHFENYKIQLAGSNFRTTSHMLRRSMSIDEVQRYLRTITMQMEITRFLCEKISIGRSVSFLDASDTSSIYSVSSSQAVAPEMQPETSVPTLFDDSKARAHLSTAIILAGNTLGEGFSLANRIVREFKLHVGKVYGHVACKLIQSDRIDDVSVLISWIMQTGSISTDICDQIVLKAITAVLSKEQDGNDVDTLIRLVKKDTNKIDAFIICGKLKSAYLLAVKEYKMDTVLRIKEEAERINQPSVRALCMKWLNQTQKS